MTQLRFLVVDMQPTWKTRLPLSDCWDSFWRRQANEKRTKLHLLLDWFWGCVAGSNHQSQVTQIFGLWDLKNQNAVIDQLYFDLAVAPTCSRPHHPRSSGHLMMSNMTIVIEHLQSSLSMLIMLRCYCLPYIVICCFCVAKCKTKMQENDFVVFFSCLCQCR